MHEMQTIVTDVVSLCIRPAVTRLSKLGFALQGSFGAAIAKSRWPLVFF